MKKALLVASMIAMIIPFVLEFLLFAGILKENGSTIEDRRPVYVILMYTGIAGIVMYILTTWPLRLRSR